MRFDEDFLLAPVLHVKTGLARKRPCTFWVLKTGFKAVDNDRNGLGHGDVMALGEARVIRVQGRREPKAARIFETHKAEGAKKIPNVHMHKIPDFKTRATR
jgi:hypothetical protein